MIQVGGKALLTRSPGQEVVPVYETVRLHVHQISELSAGQGISSMVALNCSQRKSATGSKQKQNEHGQIKNKKKATEVKCQLEGKGWSQFVTCTNNDLKKAVTRRQTILKKHLPPSIPSEPQQSRGRLTPPKPTHTVQTPSHLKFPACMNYQEKMKRKVARPSRERRDEKQPDMLTTLAPLSKLGQVRTCNLLLNLFTAQFHTCSTFLLSFLSFLLLLSILFMVIFPLFFVTTPQVYNYDITNR